MSNFRNTKQKIDYYKGLAGDDIERIPYMNDAQYLEYLRDIVDSGVTKKDTKPKLCKRKSATLLPYIPKKF